jgi:hypothetical protein
MLAVIAAIIRSLSLSFTRRPHFDASGNYSFPHQREIFIALFPDVRPRPSGRRGLKKGGL